MSETTTITLPVSRGAVLRICGEAIAGDVASARHVVEMVREAAGNDDHRFAQQWSAHRLTPTQLRILKLIDERTKRDGFSPTMQELAEELGVSKVTIFEHVAALVEKEAVTRDPHKARSLRVKTNGKAVA